jgi:PAS domain S-box-containing protein
MENRKIKILLIEDSVDDAELIRRKLEKSAGARFQVTTVKNLRDGLEQVVKNKPDLILSDLGLPDSHGLDTVTKILLEVPHIPLVVLSGFDDEAIAIKAVQSGAQDYLVKGRLETSQLERSLYYSIERARLQAELEQHAQEIFNIQANLHKILEKNADAIVVVSKDGRILFTNPAAESLLGHKQKELLSQPFNFPLDGGKTSEIEIKHQDNIIITAEMNVVEISWEGSPAYLASLRNITRRKKMEEDLRESEEKFSRAFHASGNLFAINRIKDGNFIEVNESFTRMTGYTREEVIGHNANDLNLWATAAEHDRIVKLTRDNKRVRDEQIKIRAKSGEIHTGLFSSEQITIGGEACFIHTITDITELIKAQQSLRVSEEKFSKSFHNSPEVIVISSIEDGTILEANDTFLRLTGYAREEVIDKKSVEVGIWAVPEERMNVVKKLKEKGIVSNEECRFRMKSGEIRIWLFSAEIINIDNKPCMLSVTTDITERKKMEDALREREKRFSDIAENTLEWIWEVDVNGKYTYSSPVVEKILGYKPEEILEKHFYSFFLPEEREELKKATLEAFAQKQPFYDFINRNIHKNGKIVDLLTSGVPILDKEGNLLGYRGVDTDITERKKMEETLRFSDFALKSIHEGVFAMDNEFKITRWNEICEQLYGIKASDAIGKPAADIIHMVEEYEGQNTERINLLIEKGFNKEEQIHRTPRGDIWLDVHAQATEDNGKRYGWVSLVSDITERKKTEEKLRESEERYRDLFENASDLIQSCNAAGKFVYVNRAWRDALGYSEKEVSNLKFWDIIHPDYLAHCQQTLQKIMSGESVKNIETAFVAKDGRLIQVEGNVNPVSEEGMVVATRAIFHDITIRKEAEEKMRKIDQMKSEFLSNVSHELRTPLQSISGFTKLIMNGQVPDPATQQEFLQIIDRETMHLGNLINGLLDMSRLEAGRFQIYKKIFPIRDTFIESIKMFHSLARDKNITLSEEIPRDIPEMEVDNERMRQVVINLVGNAIKFSDPGSSINVRAEKRNLDLLFQVADHGTGISVESMKHLFERFYRAEGETVRGGTGLGLYISKQIVEAHGGRIWAESKFGEGSTFSFVLPLNGKGGNGNGKENSGH